MEATLCYYSANSKSIVSCARLKLCFWSPAAMHNTSFPCCQGLQLPRSEAELAQPLCRVSCALHKSSLFDILVTTSRFHICQINLLDDDNPYRNPPMVACEEAYRAPGAFWTSFHLQARDEAAPLSRIKTRSSSRPNTFPMTLHNAAGYTQTSTLTDYTFHPSLLIHPCALGQSLPFYRPLPPLSKKATRLQPTQGGASMLYATQKTFSQYSRSRD